MRRISIGILSLALLSALSWAVVSLPAKPTGLTEASLAKLPESGVTNPVTAVLLNYRGYDTLLWIGAFAPGGAFQGGALLGGALVLVMLGDLARRVVNREGLLRAGLVLGVLVFGTVCAITLRLTGRLLQYPHGSGGTWIMVIESAALISIGLTLGLLYLGGRPEEEE